MEHNTQSNKNTTYWHVNLYKHFTKNIHPLMNQTNICNLQEEKTYYRNENTWLISCSFIIITGIWCEILILAFDQFYWEFIVACPTWRIQICDAFYGFSFDHNKSNSYSLARTDCLQSCKLALGSNCAAITWT